MAVEILVVRYGQPELEARCIESVRRHTDLVHHKLTVFDNFKRDKQLGALWNEVIARSEAEWILLLNSDTVAAEFVLPIGALELWVSTTASREGRAARSDLWQISTSSGLGIRF